MISITKIILPMNIIKKTLEIFRDYGSKLLEAIALWVGNELKNAFIIKGVWFPNQKNSLISYYVSEINVHLINVRLNKKGYSAIAQIHTHPADAYHSHMDDEYHMLVLPGSFSIVIPDFGNITVKENLNKMVVYRYISEEWIVQTKKEVNDIFKIK